MSKQNVMPQPNQMTSQQTFDAKPAQKTRTKRSLHWFQAKNIQAKKNANNKQRTYPYAT